MPEWWPVLLLVVFATHLPFFARRWVRTREPRFAATTLTFTLLVATYALRVLAPDWRLGGVPAWQPLRYTAWAAAAVSIGLLLHHHLASRRSR